MVLLTGSPYWQLLRSRDHAALMLVGAVAKLPPSMLSLALVLAVTDRVDRATAGWCAMTLALGLVVTGPWRGRVVDRRGPRATLLWLGAAESILLLTLWLALMLTSTPLVLLGVAFFVGATTPPVAPVLRSVWRRTTRTPAQAHAAQSWESVSIDLAYILAPSTIAIVAGLSAPITVLPVVAVLVVVSTFFLAIRAGLAWSHLPGDDGSGVREGFPNRIWRIVGVSAMTAFAIVTVELGTVAVAESAGTLALSGILIALVSLGSIVGGALYGHRAPSGGLRRHFAIATLLWMAGCGVAAVSSAHVIAVGAGLALAGLGFTVLMTTQYELAGMLAPPTRTTEAFSWMTTSGQLGAAGGAAVGAHVDAQSAFALAAVAVATAAVILPRPDRTISDGGSSPR